MAYDPFDLRTLAETVDQLKRPKKFFQMTFFPRKKSVDTKHIEYHVRDMKRRVMPFTDPKAKGKLQDRTGFKVKSTPAPYCRSKRVCSTNDIVKRRFGQEIFPSTTLERRRIEEMIVDDLDKLMESLTRREELMCAQVLEDGKITIKGEGLDQEIDFEMAVSHIDDISGGSDAWTDASADPIAKLREYKRRIQKDSGLARLVCVMGHEAFDAFIQHDNVREKLDNRRIFIGSVEPLEIGGATRVAILSDPAMEIWTYDEFFFDEDAGEEFDLMPTKKIFIGSRESNNLFCYGAIQHCNALPLMEWFSNSWIEPDEGTRFISLESAPLPLFSQPDGHLTSKVVP